MPANHTLKHYVRYNEIELQAREEALRATIKYYQENITKSPVVLAKKGPKESN